MYFHQLHPHWPSNPTLDVSTVCLALAWVFLVIKGNARGQGNGRNLCARKPLQVSLLLERSLHAISLVFR